MEQQSTPLPKVVTLVLLLIVFVEAMFNSMLYPFVAFMVQDYFTWLDRKDPETDKVISFYAGLVASCFSLAQFCSAFFWGWFSDRIGRRTVLLVGMLGNTVTAPLFGVAPNYTLAVVFRCISGLVNGNVGVAKAYAREITDDTNSGKLFSYLGFSWGLGVMIGPVLGGLLSHPSRRISFLEGSIFDDYPYLLPMVINAFISLIGLIIGFFAIHDVQKTQLRKRQQSEGLCGNKRYVNCVLIYSISGLAFLGFQEVFPFWCRALRSNGGLGWDDEGMIGIIQSIGGVSVICFQFFLVPLLCAKLGLLKTMKIAWMVCIPIFLFVPFLTNFYGVFLWIWLIFCYLLFSAIQCCVLTLVGLGINNSVKTTILGTANGVAQASVSISRAIGPALCGGLFGWSASSGLSYPLNSHFMFILIALSGVGCLMIMFFGLGEDINKSRKDEELDYTSTLYTPLLPKSAWSPKDQTKPVVLGYKQRSMSENVHLEFSPMAFRKTSVPERIQLETIKDEEEDN